jgi:hypothetical protein
MCFVISLMPEQQAMQIQQADSAEKIISTATMTIVRKD